MAPRYADRPVVDPHVHDPTIVTTVPDPTAPSSHLQISAVLRCGVARQDTH
jgi:hypothetical protein